MSSQAMQNEENHFQGVGICHRIFNFILNILVGVGLKRVTLGHPMPRGSTDGKAELIGDERENSKPKDVSDSVFRINFKQTEEEPDYLNWNHVDEPDSSSFSYVAEKDDESNGDEAMERRNEFIDDDKPEVHWKTGKHIAIPITDSSKSVKPVLTGLGLNINEISAAYIQNMKQKLRRNVSFMKPKES